MTLSHWERRATALGIAASGLMVAAFVLADEGAPGADATRQEIVAYYADSGTELKQGLAMLLVGLAGFLFLPFLGTLRGILRRAEGGSGSLSATAFAGGVVLVGMLFTAQAVNAAVSSGAGFFDADAYQVDSNIALTFSAASFYLGGFASVAGGVFVSASSTLALRSRLLPKWLALLGLVFGVAGGLGGILFWGVPVLAYALWIILTSIVLMRRPVERPAPVRDVATSHA